MATMRDLHSLLRRREDVTVEMEYYNYGWAITIADRVYIGFGESPEFGEALMDALEEFKSKKVTL